MVKVGCWAYTKLGNQLETSYLNHQPAAIDNASRPLGFVLTLTNAHLNHFRYSRQPDRAGYCT